MKVFVSTLTDWKDGMNHITVFSTEEKQMRDAATFLAEAIQEDSLVGGHLLDNQVRQDIRQLLNQEEIEEALELFHESQQDLTLNLDEREVIE